MASSDSGSFASLGIKNTSINEASGVQLSQQQKVLVGSVLDLFEGNPTLKHLGLWSKTATFSDPITQAVGFDKFAAQWYGLPAVFNPIALQSHKVTSAGNPITLDVRNKYTIKGIKKDQVIDSEVRISVGQDGKIEKVEDRWNGKLPEGAISEVSYHGGAGEGLVLLPVNLWIRLANVGASWAWWTLCTGAWSWPFLAFRKLNAVTVPTLVRVPKNDEEDMKMKAEREGK